MKAMEGDFCDILLLFTLPCFSISQFQRGITWEVVRTSIHRHRIALFEAVTFYLSFLRLASCTILFSSHCPITSLLHRRMEFCHIFMVHTRCARSLWTFRSAASGFLGCGLDQPFRCRVAAPKHVMPHPQTTNRQNVGVFWGFLGPIEICQALRHLGFHTSPDEILDWLEVPGELQQQKLKSLICCSCCDREGWKGSRFKTEICQKRLVKGATSFFLLQTLEKNDESSWPVSSQAMDESGDHVVSYREFFSFVKHKVDARLLTFCVFVFCLRCP